MKVIPGQLFSEVNKQLLKQYQTHLKDKEKRVAEAGGGSEGGPISASAFSPWGINSAFMLSEEMREEFASMNSKPAGDDAIEGEYEVVQELPAPQEKINA